MTTQNSFDITSTLQRHPEFPDYLEFTISAVIEGQKPIAKLTGYRWDFRSIPTLEEITFNDFVEAYNTDGGLCFDVLAAHTALVSNVLGVGDRSFKKLITRAIYLDKVKVSPEWRGHNLALRLMREARFIFNGKGTIALLRAYPFEEENAALDVQLKLAGYYASDAFCGFKVIDGDRFGGHMAALWDGDVDHCDDNPFWEPPQVQTSDPSSG
ncbi:hypothetical protein [Ahrensia marina]|uniref:N-acetyltransferase domain-containing protein n=1 Tax=Ahrensia marina TaxID=1514904 RepID=A0A0M9GNI4_9HYPH|nr:hypothetical protein [Ahrensia marina]KPB02057.1 hypothetical protein SU32_04640 [Ahrensia marina]